MGALALAGPRTAVKILTHEVAMQMMTWGLDEDVLRIRPFATRVSAESSHGADRRIDFHL